MQFQELMSVLVQANAVVQNPQVGPKAQDLARQEVETTLQEMLALVSDKKAK